jgi:S1-C subfamily serine protease
MTFPRKATPLQITFIALLLAALACSVGGGGGPVTETAPTAAPAVEATRTSDSGNGLSREARAALIAATVRIFGMKRQQGELTPIYVGSGTLISDDGLILTNAHVASPASQGDASAEPDALAVAVIESEDKPPVFSYLAEVKAVDGFLDLAVIRITATLDGAELDARDLDLPYVPVGDSNEVRIGDALYIFGYPAIGGDTLTFTTGNVSGFTAEEQIGDRAWIKTDATISGGNSGGLGADVRGRIIGVPTIASSGADTDITDCRVVQDTNGDGRLTNDDTCIPIGGFINALRPVNLALPLIEAAEKDRAYDSPYGGGGAITAPGSGGERFADLRWFTLDANDDFDEEVSAYAAGVTVLVARFEFEGMTDGQEWREIWTHEGETVYEGSYAWDQGERGEYFTYLNNGGEPMPAGAYTVQLFAGPDMSELIAGAVTVGGGGSAQPTAPGEVTVTGRITDGDTNKPIRGAFFIVLQPGITYEQWDGSEAEVFSFAQTDRRGDYELPDKLQRGVAYTIVVQAEGYQTKFGDDLVWTADDPDDYTFDVSLVR